MLFRRTEIPDQVRHDGKRVRLSMFHTPPSTDLTAREAELASRSDTGLRKQTGEGEAFTGGGMFFPPKKWSLSRFFAREAELASRSDTGEGEAFTGGGMHFPPINGVCPVFCPRSGTGIAKRYWPAQADWRRRSLYWRRDALPAKKFTFLPLSLP